MTDGYLTEENLPMIKSEIIAKVIRMKFFTVRVYAYLQRNNRFDAAHWVENHTLIDIDWDDKKRQPFISKWDTDGLKGLPKPTREQLYSMTRAEENSILHGK